MHLQKDTRQKIIRDALISLFIYALPVVLMFLTFYITGKKPWLHKPQKNTTTIIHHKISYHDKNS
jgi:hypothetical protein